MGFRTVRIRDLQAPVRWALNCGPFGSKLVQRDYVDEGIPVIRGVNLSGDARFHANDFVFVSTQKADELRPNNAHPGDLVFTQRGTLGQVGLIPQSLPFHRYVISQSQMKLTVDRLKADPLFIYYVFKSPATIQRILNHAFSSGVPHINLEILRDFEIEIPKLCVQRKIAAFLSAYDDLIENNTRRIKILEEMAQMLYREWFVHFRFPGHEKVRMVESELGPIPEGWTIRALGDIAKITMGLSPKGDTYNQEGEGTPLINGPVEFGDRFTKAVKWTTTPTKCCEKGDLIVCVRGSTTGRFVKSDGVYCLGRGVCAMNSKYRSFLDLLYVEEMPTLLAQTGGSTFPSWTGPQIKSHRVRYPNEPLLERYEEVARPMRDAVQCYVQANLNLRTTRDLLLPKLISGEVHVEANEGTAAVLQEEIALRV